MKKHNKTKSSNNPKIKSTDILVVFVLLLLVLAIIHSTYQSPNTSYPTASSNYNQTSMRLSNINGTDVKNATGLEYNALLDNYVTIPSPILKEQGFEAISASVFNYSSIIAHNATYPQTIISLAYLAQNSVLANQILYSAINPSKVFLLENSTEISLRQNMSSYYYNYSGIKVTLYTALNIPTLNGSNVSYNAPIYQYTTAFAIGNISGIVTIGGNYKINPSTSINLSKALFRKLVKSSAIN